MTLPSHASTDLRFDGLVALVTGGARGIGRAYADLLASRGCAVVIADAGFAMDGQPGDGGVAAQAAAAIRDAGGRAAGIAGDVLGDAAAIVDFAVEQFGRLDILINNAGPAPGFVSLSDADPAAWQRVSDVHYHGTVAMCRAAWPHLAKSGAGRILNTASTAMLGAELHTDYGAAKAAIFGLTRSLAEEGRAQGINANVVLPSGFTRMMETIPDETLRKACADIFQTGHIAAFAAWLIHRECAITGEAFNVGGGRAARVVIASGPPVILGSASPEQWRDRMDDLIAEGPFARFTTMTAAFASELRQIRPSLAEQT